MLALIPATASLAVLFLWGGGGPAPCHGSAQPAPLHVAAFLPETGVGFPIYSMAFPAATLAVEVINNSTHLLPDFRLVLQVFDTAHQGNINRRHTLFREVMVQIYAPATSPPSRPLLPPTPVPTTLPLLMARGAGTVRQPVTGTGLPFLLGTLRLSVCLSGRRRARCSGRAPVLHWAKIRIRGTTVISPAADEQPLHLMASA